MSFQKNFALSESSEDARQVRTAWEHFLAGREEGLEKLRPIIRDSWVRCRERGIDPHLMTPPIVLSQEQVRNLREEDVLSEAAIPILQLLCKALEGSRFLVVLADSQCRLLETIGHPKALDKAGEVNYVPGSQWLEDQVGTDSLAVSLLLGMPLQIHWAEHYCEIAHEWTGNTAPIHHPFTKEVAGFLNLCGYGEIAHPRALELVTDFAAIIEQRLYKQELARRLFLFEQYNAYQSKFPRDTLLCTDVKGSILTASHSIVDLLGLSPEEAIGRLFSRLPGLYVPEPSLKVDGSGSPYNFYLHTKTSGSLKATLFPVKKERSLAGFIAILSAKSAPAKKAQADPSWRASYTFADIIGESANFLACIAEAQKTARVNLPVLIIGESGTGKELFAHAIHNASRRREGPFIPLNCGGMNEELLGAELFGYAEGAFTGAARGGRTGKLELAHGGTLFLDEVEEMSPKMQVHFLRVLEEGRVVRIGAEKPRSTDMRVIAATNTALEARVREGRFRQDLYYRLNVLTISLPPLRERTADIPLLVKHILLSEGITKEIGTGALERLKAYCWPGNVRQLRNVLLQATDCAAGRTITEVDLLPEEGSPERGTMLQKAEREAILRALRECGGNIPRAASQLGLHRATLYRKMEKHGIRAERMWQ